MKLIFAFITAFVLFIQVPTLETLRENYPQASMSKANADKFAVLAEKTSSSNAVFQAYKGAAKIIQSKFEKGNTRKPMIVSGVKALENSISVYPNQIELRVIRLSVQENLPKIVGYNTKIKEDKNFILKNYSKQNSALKQYIREFAAVSKSMTLAEKASLK